MQQEKLMWILWPSFLSAIVLSAIVFGFVDPLDIIFLDSIRLSRYTVYALGFFLFWLMTAVSSLLTLALSNQSNKYIFRRDEEDDFF